MKLNVTNYGFWKTNYKESWIAFHGYAAQMACIITSRRPQEFIHAQSYWFLVARGTSPFDEELCCYNKGEHDAQESSRPSNAYAISYHESMPPYRSTLTGRVLRTMGAFGEKKENNNVQLYQVECANALVPKKRKAADLGLT